MYTQPTTKQQRVVGYVGDEAELAYCRSLKSGTTAAVEAVILKTLTTHGFQLFRTCGLCLRDHSSGAPFKELL